MNLSNFNTRSTETLEEMFYNCNSLSSLELGEFINSNVNNMRSMFSGCSELTSLDLQKFNIQTEADAFEMFKNCNKIIINCKEKENEDQILNGPLPPSNNNCSHLCIENLKLKYIDGINKCIKNCFNEEYYKFEYNNVCLPTCPNYTHNSSFLCEKDSLSCNNKCGNCSFESNDANLCISCNTNANYFPKVNDDSNIYGFINCYNDIEGYYVDNYDKIYKNCFSNCHSCDNFIGEDRNKCNNCNSTNNF